MKVFASSRAAAPTPSPAPQTVTSKVSTGTSKSLYQARPQTVAFAKKAGPARSGETFALPARLVDQVHLYKSECIMHKGRDQCKVLDTPLLSCNVTRTLNLKDKATIWP